MASALLDAEVRLGELFKGLTPKITGRPTDESILTDGSTFGKYETIRSLGFGDRAATPTRLGSMR